MANRSSRNLGTRQLARRAEIGLERRSRTKDRLLAAAYHLFAVRGSDAPTVDDVIDKAGVARGTFYNYFDTREELFKAVAEDVAQSINDVIEPRLAGIKDPAVRLCLAFRVFLHFAVADEARGWILLRTMPLVGALNKKMKNYIHAEFAEAVSQGRFKVASVALGVDLGLGLQIMTIQRLLSEHEGDEHIDAAAEMLLVAFGIKVREAQRIARDPIDFSLFPPLKSAGVLGSSNRLSKHDAPRRKK